MEDWKVEYIIADRSEYSYYRAIGIFSIPEKIYDWDIVMRVGGSTRGYTAEEQGRLYI